MIVRSGAPPAAADVSWPAPAAFQPGVAIDWAILTFEPDFGDGSEWGHYLDLFRSPVEQRLNEWFLRDVHDCREGFGYPMGSLLSWGRRSPRDV